jgi:tetratricopeptide (TPR) repeat protein
MRPSWLALIATIAGSSLASAQAPGATGAELPQSPSLSRSDVLAPRMPALSREELTAALSQMRCRVQPGDPRWGPLQHELADTYAELELLTRPSDEAEAARAGAIRSYALASRERGYRRADEVLHALASALERQGVAARALATYRRLLDEHPRSPLRADAAASAADIAFAASDFATARALYELALRETEGAIPRAYVRYRLAWTIERLGHHRRAVRAFRAAIDDARASQRAEWAASLIEAATREVATALAGARRSVRSDRAAADGIARE